MARDSAYEAAAARVVRALRQAREKQGISMNALAAKAGLSQGMVSLVERDLRNPSLEAVIRIAHALDVDLGEIITKACREIG